MNNTVCPCGIAAADCTYHKPDANAVLRDRARRIEADGKAELRKYRVGDKLCTDLRARRWVVVLSDPQRGVELEPEIGPIREASP